MRLFRVPARISVGSVCLTRSRPAPFGAEVCRPCCERDVSSGVLGCVSPRWSCRRTRFNAQKWGSAVPRWEGGRGVCAPLHCHSRQRLLLRCRLWFHNFFLHADALIPTHKISLVAPPRREHSGWGGVLAPVAVLKCCPVKGRGSRHKGKEQHLGPRPQPGLNLVHTPWTCRAPPRTQVWGDVQARLKAVSPQLQVHQTLAGGVVAPCRRQHNGRSRAVHNRLQSLHAPSIEGHACRVGPQHTINVKEDHCRA